MKVQLVTEGSVVKCRMYKAESDEATEEQQEIYIGEITYIFFQEAFDV